MNQHDIGIVIIGRNEGQRLVHCLVSAKRDSQNVFYVDSGSTDGSINAAAEAGARVLNLDLSQPFTAARARNEGFSMAVLGLSTRIFTSYNSSTATAHSPQLLPGRKLTNLSCEWNAVSPSVCGRRRERFPTASVFNYGSQDIEWNTPIA